MNVSSGSLREDVILLNIVRASQFEPMNFVALSKYNGSGTIEAGVQANRNDGLIYDILNKGALVAGTTATGSVVKQAVTPSLRVNTAGNFDLAPLDNKEFYAGFLAQLELSTINLLVNAGMSRELVLHSIVGAARITGTKGDVHILNNNPFDDSYQNDTSEAGARRCSALSQQGAFKPVLGTPLWHGVHAHDCMYQKFLHFLHGAVEFGMTTETTEMPNPLAAKDKAQPKTVSRITICYDPALARMYNRDVTHNPSRCGVAGRRGIAPSYGSFSPHVRLIEPIMRSSYGVYQYFGRMLATDTAKRVRLIDAGSARLPTKDNKILTITKASLDCFARASHPTGEYCVPAAGANNTKEIFFLLNTLVYLSTTRSSLPTTPTVQLAP